MSNPIPNNEGNNEIMITFKLTKKTGDIAAVADGGAAVGVVTRTGGTGPTYRTRQHWAYTPTELTRILRQMGVSIDAKFEEKVEKAVAEQTQVLSQARALRFGKTPAAPVKRSRKKDE
jgi:2-hydroxychromene-2-carboxylate isomerase